MEQYLYRARYEYPKTGKKAWITFAATPPQALEVAATFAKSVRGYLLCVEEDRPLILPPNQLELT